jgi:hypothetical protein
VICANAARIEYVGQNARMRVKPHILRRGFCFDSRFELAKAYPHAYSVNTNSPQATATTPYLIE